MRAPSPPSLRSAVPDPSIVMPDDAAVFAVLLIDDPGHALRLLAEMPEPLRLAQAVLFAGCLHSLHLPTDAQALPTSPATSQQRRRP